MTNEEREHLAFSILHGTFNPESTGGCSCELCEDLLTEIAKLCAEEAARFYAEHYPLSLI